MFTAAISIDVTVNGETKKLEKSHTCVGKKQAAQHCALEMIKELYALSLVEANVGPQQSKKKSQRSNQRMHPVRLTMLIYESVSWHIQTCSPFAVRCSSFWIAHGYAGTLHGPNGTLSN